MKTIKLMIPILIIGFVFTYCKKDDDNDEPDNSWVEAYNNADMSKGGIMYDKFWSTESGFDQNNQYMNTLSESSNFFRCKQCHGWDGLGSNGAYISRGPKTTRPNVSSLGLYEMAKTKTAKELFDGMKKTAGRRDISYDLSTYDPDNNSTEGDKMPDLNQLLTDAQIWDNVKFMKESMFDVTELYDAAYEGTYPTGSMTISNVGKDGNAANGNAYYTANCAGCHGADGTIVELEGKTLGKFVRTKANEVQHKVKYGQLGSAMVGEFDISISEMKDLYKACADTVAFPN
jgi:cytochrome c553